MSARIIALLIAVEQVWIGRYDLFPDSVSYLDIGEAYVRGDWGHALNGAWSPLYAFLLGVTNRLVRPSPQHMFPVARITNLVIFIATLAAFEWFIRMMMKARAAEGSGRAEEPEWPWLILFYGLFFWSSFSLLTVSRMSPDMCVAGFVYAMAALILSIRLSLQRWPMFLLFGVALGMSYLAKTAMFPVALVFLLTCFLLIRKNPHAVRQTAVAAAGFLAISLPFAASLSYSKRRITIGDAGRFNYTLAMDGIQRLAHWQRDVLTGKPLKHPTRKLFDQPAVFEFAAPVGGTYPPWTEPYYWFEGMSINFSLRRQLSVLALSMRLYWPILMPFVLGAMIMASLAREPFWKRDGIFSFWPFLCPAAAALGMYAVVRVEYRYVAPFIVVLWTGIFAGTRIRPEPVSLRVIQALLLGTTLVLLAPVGLDVAEDLAGAGQRTAPASISVIQRTAAALESAGVQPGAKAAVIAGLLEPYWARMLGIRIIAEVPYDQRMAFWLADAGVQRRVLSLLRGTGATIVVAENVPPLANTSGWQQVGGADVWWLDLRLYTGGAQEK